jgi:hypothetical protein
MLNNVPASENGAKVTVTASSLTNGVAAQASVSITVVPQKTCSMMQYARIQQLDLAYVKAYDPNTFVQAPSNVITPDACAQFCEEKNASYCLLNGGPTQEDCYALFSLDPNYQLFVGYTPGYFPENWYGECH